jgi:hypothetical protein
MPVLREQDFDKIATRVVDKFLSGQSKLAEAAAEAAAAEGMTPDQIERLTQSANTMAFLKMMDQRKQEGAGDLMHEFDPIDSRHVIKIDIDDAGVHVEPMDEGQLNMPHEGHDEHELPDEMAALREPEMPEGGVPDMGMAGDESGEPDDSEDDVSPEPPAKEKPAKKTDKKAAVRINRLRKLASVLDDQYRQAEWTFRDTFEDLAAQFNKVYRTTSFEAFEKDALAESGDVFGIQVMNGLRERRGMPHLDVNTTLEKVAALSDHHVSCESKELQMFEALVKTAREADKLQRGLEWVKAQCA